MSLRTFWYGKLCCYPGGLSYDFKKILKMVVIYIYAKLVRQILELPRDQWRSLDWNVGAPWRASLSGGLGRSPSRVQGQSLWWGQWAKPLEAGRLWKLQKIMCAIFLHIIRLFLTIITHCFHMRKAVVEWWGCSLETVSCRAIVCDD